MDKTLAKRATVVFLAFVLFTTFVYGLVTVVKQITTVGNIQTIGALSVYWDIEKTNATTNINWGTILNSENKTETFYVFNEGSINLSLDWWTENWNSASRPYVTVTSTLTNGTNLPAPDGSIPVSMTVFIDALTPSNVTSFSFDIFIRGTEV